MYKNCRMERFIFRDVYILLYDNASIPESGWERYARTSISQIPPRSFHFFFFLFSLKKNCIFYSIYAAHYEKYETMPPPKRKSSLTLPSSLATGAWRKVKPSTHDWQVSKRVYVGMSAPPFPVSTPPFTPLATRNSSTLLNHSFTL